MTSTKVRVVRVALAALAGAGGLFVSEKASQHGSAGDVSSGDHRTAAHADELRGRRAPLGRRGRRGGWRRGGCRSRRSSA